MLEVTEINSLAELETLQPEWESLLGRSRNATIFQTPEWLLSHARGLGHGKLVVLAVRKQGTLVALAPLEIVSAYGLPLRRLQFLGTGSSDYLDFILDQTIEEHALEAILTQLERSAGRWDILDLQQIPQQSPTRDFWAKREFGKGFTPEMLPEEDCPYLPLPESWEQFSAGLGKKTRWNLGYYERIARRDFEFAMGTLGPGEISEGMDAFFHLHAQRWRKRKLPGVLVGKKRQDFHREAARRFSEKGWLRLYSIRLNRQIQAILYCFSYQTKGYYYLGGFEPALSKYSLGTVLTAAAIRDSIEHGLTEFDFLRGNEPYKSRWTHERRVNSRLILRKSALRSHLARRAIAAAIEVEHRFKEALWKRLGGKSRG